MKRLVPMLVTLGPAAWLPAVSGCGDFSAATPIGEANSIASDGVRANGTVAGGGAAGAVEGAERSATRPPPSAPATA
jgi:hypothetical protein